MKKFKLGFCLVLLCFVCIGCTNKSRDMQTFSKNDKAYQEFKDRENAELQKEIAYKYRDSEIKATIQYNASIGEDTGNPNASDTTDIVLWGFPDNAEQSGTYNVYFTNRNRYIYIRQYPGDSDTTKDYQVYLDTETYTYVTEYIKYIDDNNIVDYERVGELITILSTNDIKQIKDWLNNNAPLVFKNNYAYANYSDYAVSLDK